MLFLRAAELGIEDTSGRKPRLPIRSVIIQFLAPGRLPVQHTTYPTQDRSREIRKIRTLVHNPPPNPPACYICHMNLSPMGRPPLTM